jgi:thiol-disulfide isomerase/thioredoxin
MRIRPGLSRLSVGVALLLLSAAPDARFVATPSAQGSSDAAAQFAAAIQEGNQALAQRRYLAAIDAYKKANGLKDKKSPEALFNMSRAYFAMEAYKDAADRCTDALKFTGDDKRMEGQMHYMHGLSYVALALQKGSTGEFKDAEADFRATLAATDKIPVAQFQLGALLMRQNRDEDGIKELEAFVSAVGSGPDVEEAKRMIANPKRARESYAPEFAITSLQGELVQLKDLKGKVVLLDFWGTWCPPCRASTPSLVKFYKKHMNEPFVMIGVAVHDKEPDWKAYVKEHGMDWPQYFDTGSKMARAFQITVFPTYIILDGDGVIKSHQFGWGNGAEGLLDGEIKKAIKSNRHDPDREFFARPNR